MPESGFLQPHIAIGTSGEVAFFTIVVEDETSPFGHSPIGCVGLEIDSLFNGVGNEMLARDGSDDLIPTNWIPGGAMACNSVGSDTGIVYMTSEGSEFRLWASGDDVN